MKILIADDDPIPRRLLQALLVKAGYEVVAAEEGEEAWRILQMEDAPRLAILDWLMPGMDGPEICRKVRERAAAPYVYLLLLTSKDRKEDIVAGMEAGADDYLTKPFHAHELQVRVRAGLRILELEAALLSSLEELAEARRREGEIGGKIQQTLLLGRPPESCEGIRIAPLTIPSQQIDGDFYDFFPHHTHCLDVLVGDVMGKGVPAALLGAAIKSDFLRALSQLTGSGLVGQLPEPEAIVAFVHAGVTRQFIGLEIFATLCYARFDLLAGRVTFVDCGHTKTIHFQQQSGLCVMLEGDNMPLGVSEREVYKQVVAPFGSGDLFFFYSDGLTEARNSDGEFFGSDRLAALIGANSRLPPEELVAKVRQEVVSFAGSEVFGDDLTCVAVRIESVGASVPLAHSETEVASALRELSTLRRFVRDFCRQLPPPEVDEETVSKLEIAINEAASNVMRHAYRGREEERIRILADAYPDRICFRLLYRGEPFDPQQVRAPSFDGSREGGFGVYMIAQCVDRVEYGRDAHGENSIILEKYRKRTEGEQAHGDNR
ncbi:MAG: protein serine/threonine phosphatase [Chthonomonadaceae bacterium]|nr:protein serine/threonine phosphatase [Chthonomonadaceae bacterium]